MGWIKFEKDLQTDPRVLRMARAFEGRWELSEETVSQPDCALAVTAPLPAVTMVCGALVRLWCLADTHVDGDDVLKLSTEEIDAFIGIPGFCSLLPSGWLVDLGDTVRLPGFHIHNGTLAKTRASTQRRVQRHRTVTALRSVTQQPLPDLDLDQTKTKERAGTARGARLPSDWKPNEQVKAWASSERPDLDLDKTLEKFRDYWTSKAGQAGRKLDWDATFRNWVREERASAPGSRPPKKSPCAHCRKPINGSSVNMDIGLVCSPCHEDFMGGKWS